MDGRDFVTGKHQYTSDLTRPGMLHGKVLRPEGFKARLVSVDARRAEKPGVKVVRDGDFVGVVAPDAWTAERALSEIESKWDVPAQPSDKEIFEYLKKNEETGGRDSRQVKGSVEEAMVSADVKLAQTYTVEYIAHAPLEPRAAVAEWNGDRLTVWTGTQRPFAVRDELAEALRIPAGACAGPGARHGLRLRRQAHGGRGRRGGAAGEGRGKPVKVVWTREEEFTLGLLPPRRRDRGLQRRAPRRNDHGLGVSQLQLRSRRDRDAVRRSRTRRSSSTLAILL